MVVATHTLGDINQICGPVVVMHEGLMIFVGSMRDMKRRLRRDAFTLELEAGDDELDRLAEGAARIGGILASRSARHTLSVQVAADRDQAGALAEMLAVVAESGLSLQSIHSGLNETENAYLQLLDEDEAHGFQRFDLAIEQESIKPVPVRKRCDSAPAAHRRSGGGRADDRESAALAAVATSSTTWARSPRVGSFAC